MHKYEAGEESGAPDAPQPAYEDLGQLPNTYDSTVLYLIARDPRWLFAYWDVDWGAYPAGKMEGGVRKVYMRIHGGEEDTIEINLEARNWYVPVAKAGTAYTAEIGYFDTDGEWNAVAQSNTAHTPSDSISGSAEADFATVPLHLTFQRMIEMVKDTMWDGESLLSALARLQGDGKPLTFGEGTAPGWTEEQKRVLAALVGDEVVNRLSMGSAGIDQLLRRHLARNLNTESAGELALGGRFDFSSAESSLFGALGASWGGESFGASWSAQPFGAAAERGFFLHVNAEVIFYGGTHPDAKVTIDGKPIQLNPDGSFRYHFKFPDGNYQIPIVAQSPDKVEERSATLAFERQTGRKGEVGATAQPKSLKKPIGRKR